MKSTSNQEELAATAAANGPEIHKADPEKLARRDNEIVRNLDRRTGHDEVRDPQPGFRYARITCADGHGNGPDGDGALQNIRRMHDDAERFGYEPVQGDDPEDKRLQKNDIGTMRKLGDTHLYRISEANYQRMQQYQWQKAAKLSAVEENIVHIGNQRLAASHMGRSSMHGGAGDLTGDPLMQRRFGGAGRPEKIMVTGATEGDFRRGSLRDQNGNVVPPGFETGAVVR